VDKALAAPALRQAIIYRAEHKPDAMVSAFRSAAEAGNPVAELQLAELYRQGVDIQQDDDLADSWLQKAAAQGLGEAQVMLAERAFANPDGQQTPAAGWYWLMLAQTQQRPAIWTMIGQLYLAGVLPLSTAQAQSIPDLINDTSRTPDTADALTYFHRAADAGDESGELALCLFYMRGEGGTAPSPGTGKQWCDRAAARGNLEARKYSSTTAQLPTPLPSPDKDGPIVVALEYVGDGAILLVYGAFYLLAQCGGSGFHGF
jgi:TPR repeat protein